MLNYFTASLISGILFGILDGLINANPLANKLFEVYKPIVKTSINIPAGFVIDIIYGFVMAWLFLLLYKSLPGSTNLIKGLSFGFLIWFFRVFMSVASSWMMYKIPTQTLFYSLISGLLEMLIIGLFYGFVLKP